MCNYAKIATGKRPYRKKQYWVAPYLKDRLEHSFYYVSMSKLTIENGVRFHNYFRMSVIQLEELLSIVGSLLVKQNVVRESIPPKERLAITLRFILYNYCKFYASRNCSLFWYCLNVNFIYLSYPCNILIDILLLAIQWCQCLTNIWLGLQQFAILFERHAKQFGVLCVRWFYRQHYRKETGSKLQINLKNCLISLIALVLSMENT